MRDAVARERMAGLKALMDERNKAGEKALELVALSFKEYKAGANEWRDTVKDLIANQAGRREQNQWLVATIVGIAAALPGTAALVLQLLR